MSNSWVVGEPLLRAARICRSFFKGGEVPVLRGVDLEIRRGEFASIIGASGSGKTTLLHLLGTLDRPTSGEVYWKGQRIDDKSDAVKERYRLDDCGFVFQFYHLLPELSALENVLLPTMIRLSPWSYWHHRSRMEKRAQELLDRVGLAGRMRHRPAEMSGGEMQRTAIARALMAEPEVLLADEPTGNLDAETGSGIFDLLDEIRRENQLTLVLVTHDLALAERANTVYRLAQGTLSRISPGGRAWTSAVAG